MSLKPLSERERAAALQKAAAARTIRAEIKQKVKAGKLGIPEVIATADKDEAVGRLKVSELLEALPGVGQVRASAIMEHIGIAQTRRLRGLGIHQRKALTDWFDDFRTG